MSCPGDDRGLTYCRGLCSPYRALLSALSPPQPPLQRITGKRVSLLSSFASRPSSSEKCKLFFSFYSFFPFYTMYSKDTSIVYIRKCRFLHVLWTFPSKDIPVGTHYSLASWAGPATAVSRGPRPTCLLWSSAPESHDDSLGPGPAVELLPGSGLSRSCPSLLQPGAGKPKSSHVASPLASSAWQQTPGPLVPLPPPSFSRNCCRFHSTPQAPIFSGSAHKSF